MNGRRDTSHAMRVIAEPIRAADLQIGDLFSNHGPIYWQQFPRFLAVGHGLFLRTAAETPEEDAEVIMYRLRLVPDVETLPPTLVRDLPEKWQTFARSALVQTPESLVGINPEVLHDVNLALLSDLAETAQNRDHWRNTAEQKSEMIANLLRQIARLQQERKEPAE